MVRFADLGFFLLYNPMQELEFGHKIKCTTNDNYVNTHVIPINEYFFGRIYVFVAIKTNSMAYGTLRFNAGFTRTLQ